MGFGQHHLHQISPRASAKELAEQNGESVSDDADKTSKQDTVSASIETQTNGNKDTTHIEENVAETRNPIAVFKQIESTQGRTAGFQFEGWYRVDGLEILEPRSPELVRMLEQKWSRKNKHGKDVIGQRRGVEWEKSMSYQWAVMKMKIDEDASGEKGEPQIERLVERVVTTPKKSVNEQLAELRMTDAETKTGCGKISVGQATSAEA